MARFLSGALVVIALLVVAGMVAWKVSPWPSALFYRVMMDIGGRQLADALEKHVPPGVTSVLDIRYDPGESAARFDVFYPSDVEGSERVLTTIVWVHGGGFISGSKSQIANYARILASKGYTVVSVDYTLAPRGRYPSAMRQVNHAPDSALREWKRLHIDPNRIVLAGDSAGAQIAGQLANLISNPTYAQTLGDRPAITRPRLIGAILYCGLHDPTLLALEGPFAGFLRTTGWSYFGTQDFLSEPRMAEFSVVGNVTSEFPPLFVSAGNADPLLPHSLALAEAAERKGVRVERLFFPADYAPPLLHEYQFNLDTEAGKLALERSLAFLASLKK